MLVSSSAFQDGPEAGVVCGCCESWLLVCLNTSGVSGVRSKVCSNHFRVDKANELFVTGCTFVVEEGGEAFSFGIFVVVVVALVVSFNISGVSGVFTCWSSNRIVDKTREDDETDALEEVVEKDAHEVSGCGCVVDVVDWLLLRSERLARDRNTDEDDDDSPEMADDCPIDDENDDDVTLSPTTPVVVVVGGGDAAAAAVKDRLWLSLRRRRFRRRLLLRRPSRPPPSNKSG